MAHDSEAARDWVEAPLEDPFGLSEFPYALQRMTARCSAFIEPSGLSSVGVIEADQGLVLVDSTIHPYYARKIVERLEETYKKPILHLINTHFHRDHTFGNQCVRPVRGILAHRLCAEYQRRYLEGWLKELPSSYDAVRLVPPGVTFDGDHFVIEELSLEVAIMQTGGHTHDSCIVHVPSEGVVFSGDAVFNRVPPYVAHWSCVNHFGRISKWIESLALIQTLAPEVIVPGHGELAGIREIDGLRRFFEYYMTLVQDGVTRGERLQRIWHDIQASSNFQRRELEADVYLHLTMALYDELTGESSLFEK